jgi:hypothetical protein
MAQRIEGTGYVVPEVATTRNGVFPSARAR